MKLHNTFCNFGHPKRPNPNFMILFLLCVSYEINRNYKKK